MAQRLASERPGRYAHAVLRPRLALVLALALSATACGATASSTPVPSPPDASSSLEPGSSDAVQSGGPSADPGSSPSPVASSPGDSVAPSPSPPPSGPPSAAAACTGSRANRDFFANAALALPWPVVCAVLPDGWFLSSGSYQLASGGKLLAAYKGPGGEVVELSEGAFCHDLGGCVPPGAETGGAALTADPAAFAGTFVNLDDGGFAIVVNGGAAISWLFAAHGLDEQTARSFATATVVVGG